IETAADSQRWSQTFDRELDVAHIFAIQDDIARAVARALSTTLAVHTEPSLDEGGTRDLEAYDLYLRGKAIAEQSGARGAIRSAELFREAVTRDPTFAAAWFRLVNASRSRLIFAPERSAGAVNDIEEATEKALALAPDWWASSLAKSGLHLWRR